MFITAHPYYVSFFIEHHSTVDTVTVTNAFMNGAQSQMKGIEFDCSIYPLSVWG